MKSNVDPWIKRVKSKRMTQMLGVGILVLACAVVIYFVVSLAVLDRHHDSSAISRDAKALDRTVMDSIIKEIKDNLTRIVDEVFSKMDERLNVLSHLGISKSKYN